MYTGKEEEDLLERYNKAHPLAKTKRENHDFIWFVIKSIMSFAVIALIFYIFPASTW
jgi:hypothetical protein